MLNWFNSQTYFGVPYQLELTQKKKIVCIKQRIPNRN
jgi:hypothetical protein